VPDIRYVCLSDLHLGAQSSILTALRTDLTADVHKPSPVLTRLVDCLGDLVARNEDGKKPALVLCGDVLELALSDDNVAAMVFGMFVRSFLGRERQLFDDTIYFVPGNHDHHLWETAREAQYASYVRSCPAEDDLKIPWHTTRMRTEKDPAPVESELLTTLVRRYTDRAEVSVRAVYPNLALSTADGSRCVVFHHGHFVEPMYTLMSTLKDMLFPDQRKGNSLRHIWEWEAENFAWIDFFWSTLGRSGDVGTDVGLMYASLQSRAAMRPLATNLARGIAERTTGPAWLDGVETAALGWVLDRAASRAFNLERSKPAAPLTARAQAGLHTYLDQPLRDQIRTEFQDGTEPGDVTFVFGHTHKPFEGVLHDLSSYPAPVRIYNTGGWVVDTTEPEPVQGAAAILLDENLSAVSVRLYNQSPDVSQYRVRLERADPGPDDEFFERISQLVDPDRQPWSGLSRLVAELVQQRHAALATMIEPKPGPTPS
jgi:hypothetical protein